MRTCVTGILLAGILLMAVPAVAQECGDATGDGNVDISDLVMVIESILDPDLMLSPDFHAAEADCDGRAGITLADAVAICDYRYRADDHRDCSAGLTYSMTLSESDTIFIPYINDVPIGTNVVNLPIMASLTGNVEGVYISLLTGATETDGLFELTGVDMGPQDGYITATTWQYPTAPQSDSCMLQLYEMAEDRLEGLRNTFFTLEFTRYATGVGSIAPTEYLRSSLMRITIERNGDLFVPVIFPYNVVLPDPALSVTPTSLSFTAVSGDGPGTSYEISFTSTERPVTFDLDISAPWLTLDGAPAGPYTTPVSFWITADATSLFPASYAATITPVSLDPAEAILVNGVVAVDFDVAVPGDLPWGDINCDGKVSIGDISLLIDCVFINTRPVPDCR